MSIKTLGVVLARAGSKGLPEKNSRPVAGKPMLSWTIEHALASPALDRVVLSTDGQELAQIGRKHKIEVVHRPYELAHDTAPVDAAARHAVTSIIGMHEQVVILYANVPVRPADLVQRAVDKLQATGCDSVQSVCPVGKHHPYWMQQVLPEPGVRDPSAHAAGHGRLEPFHANQVDRRQDLPPLYVLDGGIIAVRRDSLFHVVEGQPHAFLGDDRRAIITQPGEVIDVDSPLELHVAEAVLNEQQNAARGIA